MPVTCAAVAEICRRLDGIPLAIQLAAARVVSMSPLEIAQRLDERFRLLTGGRRTAVERHHTLRVTVDGQTRRCDERDRPWSTASGCVRRRLRHRRGRGGRVGRRYRGMGRASTRPARPRGEIARQLREDTEAGTTLYEMLETLRHYARERLDRPRRRRTCDGAALTRSTTRRSPTITATPCSPGTISNGSNRKSVSSGTTTAPR